MPMYDYKYLLSEAQVVGNAGDEYSDNEVNFGIVNPGVAKSNNFGLIFVVTAIFATMVDCQVCIVHGAATAPTTLLVSRYFVLADLITLGQMYYIPCPPTILQYARMLWDVVTTNPTTGAVTAWFGTPPGSAL